METYRFEISVISISFVHKRAILFGLLDLKNMVTRGSLKLVLILVIISRILQDYLSDFHYNLKLFAFIVPQNESSSLDCIFESN